MNAEYEITWHGSLWRESYAPKPAPPLPAPVVRDTVQTRRGRETQERVWTLLRKRGMTLAQLEATGQCGTVWNIRVMVKRLRAQGRIQIIGQRYGSEGPPAAVYGVRR